MLMLVPMATNFSRVHGALLESDAAPDADFDGSVGRDPSEHAAATTAAHNTRTCVL
jgi:hypothetical protein